MFRALILASAVFFASNCAAQSTGPGAPSSTDPTKAVTQAQPAAPAAPQAQSPAPAANAAASKEQAGGKDASKNKPKKVWTNEEIATVHGGISVVGDPSQYSSSSNSRQWDSDSDSGNGNNRERQNAIASYREQLRQLHEQQDDIDKKISEFRNFKGENSSPSGGINVRAGYSMTPAVDKIKQLEEKKKQIQAKIDAIEEEARKNGIEPGELR